VKTALRESPGISAEAARLGVRSTGNIAELERLREHFATLPYLGGIPLPWDLTVQDGWTRRQHILQEFDTEDLLGLKERIASDGELAAISVIVDTRGGRARF
jgi:hypothetical protein